jgi:hypothetical protein
VQGRLDILQKGIVSEENSVIYYKTLGVKIHMDSERNIELCRMYNDLIEEEKQYVKRFRELILQSGKQIEELSDYPLFTLYYD